MAINWNRVLKERLIEKNALKRIFIADDHQMMREGLKRLIEEQSEFQVCGEIDNGYELVDRLKEANADVLLLDVSMPGPGFIENIRRVTRTFPNIGILILSTHPEDMYAKRSFKLGASGYLTKNQSPEELVKAISRIIKGGRYVSESLGEKLAFGSEDDQNSPHELLSQREYQILCLLGQGKTPSIIAQELSLSVKTISTYRSRILTKMQLKHTVELVRYVVENNLIEQ